ncbi:MAG: AMP-binding protein [Actinocatenispora sp.]
MTTTSMPPPVGDWPDRYATDPGLSLEEIVRPFGSHETVSFVDPSGRRTLSYDRFAAHLATAAHRLREHGIGPGSMVATTISTTMPSVIAALGVWVAGGTLVSLPPPSRRALRIEHAKKMSAVLAAMGCRHLITDEKSTPYESLHVIPLAALDGDDGVLPPDVPVPDVALVQFTSGSLGTPKGVAISPSALAGHLTMISRCMGHDPGNDTVATWLPFYHDFGLICFFLAGVCGRVDQVHMRPQDFARDPSSWLRMLSDERATITGGPHFGYSLAGRVPYPDDLDLSRMKMALNGGERVNWPELDEFLTATEAMKFPVAALQPVYGLAENTVGCTCTLRGNSGPVRGPGDLVSSGRLLSGTVIRSEGTAEDPADLRIAGPWLFDGYYTADGFQPRTGDEFSTGDAGFVQDGEVFVLGRADEVISTGGRNLFAEDVEAVALQAGRPWAGTCAAFKLSTGDQRFGLCVETAGRDVPDPVGLARTVRSAVSSALSTRVEPLFVVIPGAIPRTTSGKVRRGACRVELQEGRISGRRVMAELS